MSSGERPRNRPRKSLVKHAAVCGGPDYFGRIICVEVPVSEPLAEQGMRGSTHNMLFYA